MATLLISELFPPKTGGSSRWFWEIYSRLPVNEFVIAAGNDPRQEVIDRQHALRVHRIPLSLKQWGIRSVHGLKGYCTAYRAIRRIVRAEGVQQLHCGRCLPEGWIAWLLQRSRGLPYICYVHGEEMNHAASSRELSWMIRRVLRGVTFLIANSSNTVRILNDAWGVPTERIRMLHPGVDTKRFVPASRDVRIRHQLGWGDRPVVLTVGRLQRRKGHDQLILALRRIRQQVPDVLYVIVGDGEEKDRLHQLVEQENATAHVQFLGETDDDTLIKCYQQCDLFALPNRQVAEDIEGFGMVLLEAQACGKPVIAGASGGTSETMQIPETGCVVPCDGPEILSEVVIEFLCDRPRLDRMGKAARSWVVENFDWSSLAGKAYRLFSDRTVLPSEASPEAVSI